MARYVMLRRVRTEEAKRIRRETGTNSFRDKLLTYGSERVASTVTTVTSKDCLILVRYGDS